MIKKFKKIKFLNHSLLSITIKAYLWFSNSSFTDSRDKLSHITCSSFVKSAKEGHCVVSCGVVDGAFFFGNEVVNAETITLHFPFFFETAPRLVVQRSSRGRGRGYIPATEEL